MKLWVRETIWVLADETGVPPTWPETVEAVAEMVPCDRAGAERRIWKALKGDMAVACLDDDMEWRLGLGPNTSEDPPWLTRVLAQGPRAKKRSRS